MATSYPSMIESLYCSDPQLCGMPDVLFVGSAVPLAIAPYFVEQARAGLGRVPSIVIADAGPLDLLGHLANQPGLSRRPFVAAPERVGGRLSLWGLSVPRPPVGSMRQWPYDFDDLTRRFERVESELGVHDAIPCSGRILERELQTILNGRFEEYVGIAPLAIDRDGKRFSPLQYVPSLVEASDVRLLARFRVTRLIRQGDAIVGVEAVWHDGRTYVLTPRFVCLAVGVEPALPLVRQVARSSWPLRAADHLRLDLHGCISRSRFEDLSDEALGVAVLIMECESSAGVPYHLEVKLAPASLWKRGLMQSSDNLSRLRDGELYLQIQAVAAMHDRLPGDDLLNVAGPVSPVMSTRDALFHGEIVHQMLAVAREIGLDQPVMNFRPLLTNHHCYGAFRVGEALSSDFRFAECPNLFILPPTAYVDSDDDANPTSKSIVLSSYAVDSLISECESPRSPVVCRNHVVGRQPMGITCIP